MSKKPKARTTYKLPRKVKRGKESKKKKRERERTSLGKCTAKGTCMSLGRPTWALVKSCVVSFVVLWWIWMLCDCINNLDTHTHIHTRTTTHTTCCRSRQDFILTEASVKNVFSVWQREKDRDREKGGIAWTYLQVQPLKAEVQILACPGPLLSANS